jgi:hypothetical protein
VAIVGKLGARLVRRAPWLSREMASMPREQRDRRWAGLKGPGGQAAADTEIRRWPSDEMGGASSVSGETQAGCNVKCNQQHRSPSLRSRHKNWVGRRRARRQNQGMEEKEEAK